MRTGLVVLAWVSGSVAVGLFVGWRWSRTGLGRKYPGEDRQEAETELWESQKFPQVPNNCCACPLSRQAEEILQDGRLCPYPVDGEDGLCAMCHFICVPLLSELRGIPRGV